MQPSVLVIEDELVLARNICVSLERDGLQVETAGSGEAGLRRLESFSPDVVVIDHNLPGMSGLEMLGCIRRQASKVRVVMMTGSGSEELAIEALRGGAADYLKKPFELAELRRVILRVLERRRGGGHAVAVQAGDGLLVQGPQGATCGGDCNKQCVSRCGGGIVHGRAMLGESAQMRELKKLLGKVIDADDACPEEMPPCVLITGETGTGKELVARALHDEGKRKNRPFREINCASIPNTLLEAELFGHERGAFTDARQARAGLIESAGNGTLFLDEIAELEPASQAKLLKVIEERRVRRLGSLEDRPVQARVIAATSRNLEAMVRQGLFRPDLYYRLRMIQIRVPHLRERLGDAVLLARHFVNCFAGRYGKTGIRLDAEALTMIGSHSWTGNVRELKNVIEEAVVLAEGNVIAAADFRLAVVQRGAELSCPAELLGLEESHEGPQDEATLLRRALSRNRFNVTRAARMLGISRDTFRYRARKHDIAKSGS